MENAEAAILKLLQIRELGIQLHIDHFGTGYSSLSYLHRMPTDTVKIDRSFVRRMGGSVCFHSGSGNQLPDRKVAGRVLRQHRGAWGSVGMLVPSKRNHGKPGILRPT
jgi:hypothetical protein